MTGQQPAELDRGAPSEASTSRRVLRVAVVWLFTVGVGVPCGVLIDSSRVWPRAAAWAALVVVGTAVSYSAIRLGRTHSD